jgi:hypothetical protein
MNRTRGSIDPRVPLFKGREDHTDPVLFLIPLRQPPLSPLQRHFATDSVIHPHYPIQDDEEFFIIRSQVLHIRLLQSHCIQRDTEHRLSGFK